MNYEEYLLCKQSLNYLKVSDTWSGVLRFGVTSVDPSSFRDLELPKFACPDLTSKAGFHAKPLPGLKVSIVYTPKFRYLRSLLCAELYIAFYDHSRWLFNIW